MLTLMILQKKTKRKQSDWPQIPDHPYRISIIGGSGFGDNDFII